MLPDKKIFFDSYPNIDINKFESSLMTWDDLIEIYNDYTSRIDDFQEQAELIFKKIITFQHVHSCKFRVKDPEHLIEKIIRKTLKGGELITIDNYREKLNDLIGLRAIHLYKEDWESLNNQIKDKWGHSFVGKPVANIREGDNAEFVAQFESSDGIVKKHPFGYRSIHYILTIPYDGKNYYAELQVRTIFEEGWSEIDHDIRYPYNEDNPLYQNYLGILNRLAGASDEMATMLRFIDRDQNEKIKYIAELKEEISQLNEQLLQSSIWERIKSFFNRLIGFFKKKQ
jgi:putative GTP pyrophosphokinase